MKKYETMLGKLYKADVSLLQDLTSDLVSQIQNKNETMITQNAQFKAQAAEALQTIQQKSLEIE